MTQRTDMSSGETQEDHSQEANHRAEDLSGSTTSSIQKRRSEDGTNPQAQEIFSQRRPAVLWPQANNKEAWRSFDEDLGMILEATLSGDVARKLRVMTTIVYNLGKERFGTQPRNACKLVTNTPTMREREIRILRKDLKALTRQYRRATAEEKTGISKLTDEVRTKLIRLRKAETIRKVSQSN